MKKNTRRLIAVNAFIYLGLLFLPPTLFYIYKSIKLALETPSADQNFNVHPAFPTEQDREHAKAIEQSEKSNETGLEFRSFIGWRRSPYTSEYENVLAPFNNRLSHNSSPNNSAWFFGGSTMWGTGASDNETIPSWYGKIKNTPVFNLGETAWTSRQSLNQLLNLLGDGYKPNKIVFYDGVNDIIHGCRAELERVPSHTQEPLIRKRLQPISLILTSEVSSQFEKLTQFIAAPYKAIGGKLGLYTAVHTPFGSLNCSLDANKAQLVANHLVNNWYAAYLLAEAHNADFMAILQPHSFSTRDVDLGYLNSAESYLKEEHDAVYPLIQEAIKKKCKNAPDLCNKFIDGSSWLDSSPPVYIDFAHITGKGNKIITEKIILKE